MSLCHTIASKLVACQRGNSEVVEFDHVPSGGEIPPGGGAGRFSGCALYTELRGAAELVCSGEPERALRLQKGFLFTAGSIIQEFGGRIADAHGGSLTALWPADRDAINRCVRAALTLKWLLDEELPHLFEPPGRLDFSIGIDWGDLLAVAAEPPAGAEGEVVYLGECISIATALGQHASRAETVTISERTHGALSREMLAFYNPVGCRVEMWREEQAVWRGEPLRTRVTSWGWECY